MCPPKPSKHSYLITTLSILEALPLKQGKVAHYLIVVQTRYDLCPSPVLIIRQRSQNKKTSQGALPSEVEVFKQMNQKFRTSIIDIKIAKGRC